MSLPSSMSYVGLKDFGGPDALMLAQSTVPQPRYGEILVRVEAAGINRPDVMQRKGDYPPPPGASPVLGLEIAGEVVSVGEGVTDFDLASASAHWRTAAAMPNIARCRPARPCPGRRATMQFRPQRFRKPSSPSGPISS